jgi:hypothetical protein
MTQLTMRVVRGDFIVTGPDIAPMKFKSRREAKDWCKIYHPASSITEIGPAASARPRNRRLGKGARAIPAGEHMSSPGIMGTAGWPPPD